MPPTWIRSDSAVIVRRYSLAEGPPCMHSGPALNACSAGTVRAVVMLVYPPLVVLSTPSICTHCAARNARNAQHQLKKHSLYQQAVRQTNLHPFVTLPDTPLQAPAPCCKTQVTTVVKMAETQHSRAAALLHKPPTVQVRVQVQAQAQAPVAAASITWNPRHCPQQVSTMLPAP
jgi:hypothetical protein